MVNAMCCAYDRITDETANRFAHIAEPAAATGRPHQSGPHFRVLTVSQTSSRKGMPTSPARCTGPGWRSSQQTCRTSSSAMTVMMMMMTMVLMLVTAICCLDSSQSQTFNDQLPTVAYVSTFTFCLFASLWGGGYTHT